MQRFVRSDPNLFVHAIDDGLLVDFAGAELLEQRRFRAPHARRLHGHQERHATRSEKVTEPHDRRSPPQREKSAPADRKQKNMPDDTPAKHNDELTLYRVFRPGGCTHGST